MAKLVPLFSGSKGNSYYIDCAGRGILIDAGRSCKQILCALEDNGIDTAKIEALFVTHEHSDHCTAVKVLSAKLNIPVFASKGTLEALANSDKLSPKVKNCVIENEVCAAGMRITRIPTPHDAAESCCFRAELEQGSSVIVATDLGTMTEELREAISQSDTAVIESNHDVNMLKNGPYPYELKRRILSNTGHLSNEACSQELAHFINCRTKRILLGHLSRENNTPELAYQTAVCALKLNNMRCDFDFTLDVAAETTNGLKIIF